MHQGTHTLCCPLRMQFMQPPLSDTSAYAHSLHIAKHVCNRVLRLSKGELGVEFDGDGQQSCTSQQTYW